MDRMTLHAAKPSLAAAAVDDPRSPPALAVCGPAAPSPTAAACAACQTADELTRQDRRCAADGMRHKPAHRHCHACGATGREGTAHERGALCGACLPNFAQTIGSPACRAAAECGGADVAWFVLCALLLAARLSEWSHWSDPLLSSTHNRLIVHYHCNFTTIRNIIKIDI